MSFNKKVSVPWKYSAIWETFLKGHPPFLRHETFRCKEYQSIIQWCHLSLWKHWMSVLFHWFKWRWGELPNKQNIRLNYFLSSRVIIGSMGTPNQKEELFTSRLFGFNLNCLSLEDQRLYILTINWRSKVILQIRIKCFTCFRNSSVNQLVSFSDIVILRFKPCDNQARICFQSETQQITAH